MLKVVVRRKKDTEMGMNASRRDHQRRAESIHCSECNSSSGLYWQGWRAFRSDDPTLDEPPALAFYCPTCAKR